MAYESILSRICIILSLLSIVFITKSCSKTRYVLRIINVNQINLGANKKLKITCFPVSIFEGGLNSVCSSKIHANVFKLKSGDDSVLIVHDGGYITDYSSRYPFDCKFTVKAREDEGLYVVIQELNFREIDNDCLDYVELSVPPNNVAKFLGAENRRLRKFCGVMEPGMWLSSGPDDDEFSDEAVNLKDKSVAPNAYIASDGVVTVAIAISHERLIDQKKLHMRLAFTSFKKRCSESSHNCRLGECIHSSLFGDRTQNCPYLSCADEYGCRKFRQKTDDWPQTVPGSSGVGTKVTFGAIGAVLLILLIFGLCLWLCKRLHRRRSRQNAAPIPVHPISRQSSVERPLPSAPIQELETKDLPPSYESLYPDTPQNDA